MTSTEDILEQIDSAVYDWEIGPDAMRCNPAEPPRAPAHDAWVFVPTVANPDAPTLAELRAAAPVPAFEAVDVAPWVARIEEWSREFAGLRMEPFQRHVLDRWVTGMNRRVAEFRRTGPEPLSINGHDYRRRQLARKRRR